MDNVTLFLALINLAGAMWNVHMGDYSLAVLNFGAFVWVIQ